MAVFRETITQKWAKNYLLGSTKYKQSLLVKCSSFCRQKSLKTHRVQMHSFDKRRTRKALGWVKVKASIKRWTSFEKVHKFIRFDQNVWLKPYIDANTE